MSTRRPVGFALAVALLAAAAWASNTGEVQPQTLTLLLLGGGLAAGAHAIKRRPS